MLYSAHAIIAQLVERIHGKDEVISSILINGSKTFCGARTYELPLRSSSRDVHTSRTERSRKKVASLIPACISSPERPCITHWLTNDKDEVISSILINGSSKSLWGDHARRKHFAPLHVSRHQENPESKTTRMLRLAFGIFFCRYTSCVLLRARCVLHSFEKDEVISSILINGSKTFYGARV